MLDFRYQTFLVVCEEKNYTKAAKRLFITQPAVSQHIHWLENKYQAKLIIYKNKQFHLTTKGKMLYQYLITLNAQIKKSEDLIKLESEHTDHLSFGATLSIAEYALSDIIATINTQRPQQNITCHVENTENLLEKIQNGSIDFALIEGNFPKDQFDYYELGTQNYICIAAADNPLTDKLIYPSEELASYTAITREPGSGTRNILETALATKNLDLTDFYSYIEVGNFKTILNLVKENIGISFLYEAVAKNELKQGTIKQIQLQEFKLSHNFYLVFLRDNILQEQIYANYQTIRCCL